MVSFHRLGMHDTGMPRVDHDKKSSNKSTAD
jgi:hypothetical protein